MDTSEIYRLIDRIETSNVDQIDIKDGSFEISIKKNVQCGVVTPFTNSPVMAPIPAGNSNPESGSSKKAAANPKKETVSGEALKAPLVGTFYRAAAPDEKPFVMIGQEVKKGDVIGIIEAMKMMNDIVAKEDGVITSIDAEDGEMVEFEQPLLHYQPK